MHRFCLDALLLNINFYSTTLLYIFLSVSCYGQILFAFQIHKRLLKEMTLKENEIIRLNDIVRNLREEKALIQEKLSYAQKQIAICMNRIKELDYKVDELSDTIEVSDKENAGFYTFNIIIFYFPVYLYNRKKMAPLNF